MPAELARYVDETDNCNPLDLLAPTANRWRGPIGKFHLSVVADQPDDIVLTCMPGLKRVGPTRYELVRSDFRPDRELDLLILHAKTSGR